MRSFGVTSHDTLVAQVQKLLDEELGAGRYVVCGHKRAQKRDVSVLNDPSLGPHVMLQYAPTDPVSQKDVGHGDSHFDSFRALSIVISVKMPGATQQLTRFSDGDEGIDLSKTLCGILERSGGPDGELCSYFRGQLRLIYNALVRADATRADAEVGDLTDDFVVNVFRGNTTIHSSRAMVPAPDGDEATRLTVYMQALPQWEQKEYLATMSKSSLFSAEFPLNKDSIKVAELWTVALRHMAVLTGSHADLDALSHTIAKLMKTSAECDVCRSVEQLPARVCANDRRIGCTSARHAHCFNPKGSVPPESKWGEEGVPWFCEGCCERGEVVAPPGCEQPSTNTEPAAWKCRSASDVAVFWAVTAMLKEESWANVVSPVLLISQAVLRASKEAADLVYASLLGVMSLLTLCGRRLLKLCTRPKLFRTPWPSTCGGRGRMTL